MSPLRGLQGFSLIESLVSIALLALVVGLFTGVLVTVQNSAVFNDHRLEANRLLTQSSEALRSIRDQNFLNLQNGDHGLQLINGVWSFQGTEDTIDNFFLRKIAMANVYRNSSGDIDSAGTILDPRTKHVTTRLTWQSDVEGAEELLARYTLADTFAFDRISTTTNEWNTGTHINTTTAGTGNGSLLLDKYIDSWQNSLNNTEYIFEEFENANAESIAVLDGKGYLVGNDNGENPGFRTLDVSDPRQISIVGTLELGANAFDVVVQPGFAYVATSHNQKELMVIDISSPASPALLTSMNLQGNKEAISLDLVQNRLYLGAKNNSEAEFFIFDITIPGQPVQIGSFEVGGDVNDLEVENNKAYLGVEGSASLIIDVTIPSQIQLLSEISATPENTAYGIALLGTTVFIGSKRSASDRELKVYDVSQPTSPILIGKLEINADVYDVDVYDHYAFITTNKDDKEFQVLEIEDLNSPYVLQNFDLGARGNRIFANDTAIYTTSNNNQSPLYIFTYPQERYFPNGEYQSAPFDSGSDTTFWHSFFWEGLIASNTTLGFQIRTADTVSNLSSAVFVGPDGTSSSKYSAGETVIQLPPQVTGTRFFQYRALMTSDGDYTPEVYSVRIQYAP